MPSNDVDATTDVIKGPEMQDALRQLQLLHDVMQKYLSPKIDIFRGNINVSDGNRVAFSDLWCLFKIGTEVRTSGKGQIQLYGFSS